MKNRRCVGSWKARDDRPHGTITVIHPGHGVREPGAIHTMMLDGELQADHAIPLVDDSREHVVEIELA